MSGNDQLPPGLDPSVYQADGDPDDDDSQAEVMIERSRGKPSSALLNIFKRGSKRKRAESGSAQSRTPSQDEATASPRVQVFTPPRVPAQKKQKQPLTAQPRHENDLESLSATLQSRANGYTTLIEHSMEGTEVDTVERIEAEVAEEVAEAAQHFDSTINTLKQNEGTGEQGQTLNKALLKTFYEDLESWEARETQKLRLKKKIMAEKIKEMLDQKMSETGS